MKAAFVDRPDGTVAVREVAEPSLGAYDARVEVLYGTLCAGTDQHILRDELPWRMPYPLVLGHDSVGRVVAVGEKVRNLAIGEVVARVGTGPDPGGAWEIGWGGFAEFGFARDWRAMEADGLPAREWSPYRIHQVIPSDIAPEIGPLFITLRETLSYANRLGIGAGTRLLVAGTGGNGLAFVAHARRAGATAVAVLGSPARAAAFRAAGATQFADYRDPDALAGLGASFPEGFTHLIDSVGKAQTADACLPYLAAGATVGVYGLDEWERIALRPARARGTFTLYNGGYDEAETHEKIVDLLRQPDFDPWLWLGADHFSYPLEKIGDAFEAVRRRERIKPLIRLAGR